ncbi:MAG: GAF domain-containing protein [Opitutales bacterium]|nr:GAF domain-containing protein [Opitutales bacterium]
MSDSTGDRTGPPSWRPIGVWRATFGIILPYLVVSILWIALSDRVLQSLVGEGDAFVRWSTYKGWMFVFVTATVFGIALIRREQARARNRRAVFELIRVIQNLALVRNKEAVYPPVLRAARALTGADGASFIMREKGQFHHCEEDAIAPVLRGRSQSAEASPAGLVVNERRTVAIRDVRSPGENGHRASVVAYAPTFVRGLALAPIRRDEPCGALALYWARPHRAMDHEKLLLETLADASAIAFEHAQAYEDLETRVAARTAELKEAMGRALESDRLKSAFLATMSHELRTPLNSILGFTGVILQELPGPINQEQRTQLGMVRDSGRHLLSLITDILDLSKIEAGRLTLEWLPFDPLAAAESVVHSLQPQADGKGLALRLLDERKDKDGPLHGDRRRIEQILINLVNNAIKFTYEGSVTVSLADENTGIRFVVADTGVGMTEDEQKMIFEPFRQLEGGIARTQEGTGLGLAISLRLARLSGGSLNVKSAPREGSTFTLRLPYSRPRSDEDPAH